MITVTDKDARSSMIMPNGWYILLVKDVQTKPASTDGSTNFIFPFEVVSDDKGGLEFEGCKVKDFLINEKGIFGSGLSFLVACGMPQEIVTKLQKKEIKSAPIDEKSCIGKKIRAFIKTSEYQGRKSNEASDFLPLAVKVA